jgi:DNA polymerase I-like protein with 3'-5' exonuclease and polymerase domains
LKDQIALTVDKKGYLNGIDGRKLHVRSAHSALNTLLQSAGGLLVKQATINVYDNLSAAGYEWGKDWAIVLHCHDEFQLQVRKGIENEVAEIAIESFRQAGRQFNWRCLVDAEAKIGETWAETH